MSIRFTYVDFNFVYTGKWNCSDRPTTLGRASRTPRSRSRVLNTIFRRYDPDR